MIFQKENVARRIDTAIRFFLYVLIFWLPYSKAVVESSVVTALLLFVVKKTWLYIYSFQDKTLTTRSRLAEAFKLPASFLNIPISIFIIFAFVSAITSAMPVYCLNGLAFKTLEWFVIYFLFLEVFREKKHIMWAFNIFLITSAAIILDTLQQFFVTNRDIFLGYRITDGRATASLQHANNLSAYLIFVVFVNLWFCLKEVNRKLRIVYEVLFVLSLCSLFLTFSRGAWVAVMVGLVVFFIWIKAAQKFRFFIIISSIIALISVGIFFTIHLKAARLDQQNLHLTASWRTQLWLDSLKMILIRPCFGYGPNTFMTTFSEFGRLLRGPAYYTPTYAHNCYIQLAAEVGFLGLLAFGTILGALFTNSLKFIRGKVPLDKFQTLSAAVLSGLLAFLLHSFVDTNFFSLQLVALFWIMAALEVAVVQLNHKHI